MDDARWRPWSLLQLKSAAVAGPLVTNDVIYAELSVRFDSIGELDSTLAGFGLAGTYRSRGGGTRTGALPKFFIGAHAATQDYRLLTRDRSRYPGYFPTLRLILPD